MQFVLSLARDVDWGEESACFKGLAAALSELYALSPPLITPGTVVPDTSASAPHPTLHASSSEEAKARNPLSQRADAEMIVSTVPPAAEEVAEMMDLDLDLDQDLDRVAGPHVPDLEDSHMFDAGGGDGVCLERGPANEVLTAGVGPAIRDSVVGGDDSVDPPAVSGHSLSWTAKHVSHTAVLIAIACMFRRLIACMPVQVLERP